MGEAFPPTAVDYAADSARQAGQTAHDAIMQVEALGRRIIRLELMLKRLIELVDEGVAGLSKRIDLLEDSQ
jgi:hypothetical protein